MNESLYEMIGSMTVAYANQERGVIVVYNHADTFLVYVKTGDVDENEDPTFVNEDMWTNGDGKARTMTASELWKYCDDHFKLIDKENGEEKHHWLVTVYDEHGIIIGSEVFLAKNADEAEDWADNYVDGWCDVDEWSVRMI